jgi:hypothetical protein
MRASLNARRIRVRFERSAQQSSAVTCSVMIVFVRR